MAAVERAAIQKEIDAVPEPKVQGFSVPVWLFVQVRYGTDGDTAHETVQLFWMDSAVGDNSWWSKEGQHVVRIGPLGAIANWAT